MISTVAERSYPLPAPIIRSLLAKRARYRPIWTRLGDNLRRQDAQMSISHRKVLDRITAPTLVMWGDRDRILDSSALETLETGIRYVAILDERIHPLHTRGA